MIDYSGTYTDLYQLTMSQTLYLKRDASERALFDYFFRKLPFAGGYAVFAGLATALQAIEGLRFRADELSFLKKQGFDQKFLNYLADFSFGGTIYSCHEGEVVFPSAPVMRVEGTLAETQIIETLLLNIVNYQSLIATKASRIRQSAGDCRLVDFGLRRAPGPAGYYASRAALIGGFDATSNVRAAIDFGIPVSGTMAHSFIQGYDDELTAFRDYAATHGDSTVLLVDTYDTLRSGIPNAVKVGLEMRERGESLAGIRLDSGDLAYLAKESRRALDDAGLDQVKIAVSNQLDEYIVKSLREQGAPIDIFGVGTSVVTGSPDAAFDGVYKMAVSGGKPRMKLTENIEKITIPCAKQVYRITYGSGEWRGIDVMAIEAESDIDMVYDPYDIAKSMSVAQCTREPLLKAVMRDGVRTGQGDDLRQLAEYCATRIRDLPPEYKRFSNPHKYKVGITARLKGEREMVQKERRER